jgi:4-hydroxysphinganine ceramide fatty acyl 2-hydroxylase
LINPIRDVRLFKNDFLESLTKTPWWMIPMCYLPLVAFFMFNHNYSNEASIPIVFIGFLSWTLAEYLLHRFFFHSEDYWLPNHPKVLVIHFFVHGIHHAFPQDRLRLVFPVALGFIIFYTLFIVPATMLFHNDIAYPFLGGLMLGYIVYDEIHYFLHHSSPKQGYFKDLKKYHMQHHYKNGTEGFGVSSMFWDYVFKTPIINPV